MAISIEFLSASSSGQPIPITRTTSSGDAIHTGVAGTTQKDEVFIYANNTGIYTYPLVLEIGGTGLSNRFYYSIPPQDAGLTLVYPGLPINNSTIIRGFCASGANIISVNGYVQRGP